MGIAEPEGAAICIAGIADIAVGCIIGAAVSNIAGCSTGTAVSTIVGVAVGTI
jgi:hypothetical protein